ncbi:MAG: crotonyl-CoA carboxylase/reductase [Chloroflexota bacterium]|nr:crotonyl-CoA carboxylase/reductase [Chloroflexota bacterium]MDE3100609.1 crotonyl-CoA carboxylase/reductase [Chloroflexota bacterium]
MLAQVIRSDRLGDPRQAFRLEEIETPSPGPGEVLIAVMAAGVNFNNVWAAQGIPVDVIAQRQRAGEKWDFHVGGSDASGIVYALGTGVSGVAVGDEVIVHPGWWDANDPWIKAGKDPMISGSARIWGYDAANFGSFAQFAVAQAHQALPKAEHLSWEEAAAPTLVGCTAYRMLFGWKGNELQPGDVVLIWGGAGGLGSQAIQLAKWRGARPVAVVSSPEKAEYCRKLGAVGTIDRREYSHWGIPPHWDDAEGQKKWLAEARRFGKAIWDAVGERRNPAIVFDHPGEQTIPTSIFVCEEGGMVVICAGTSGYSAMVDVRYLWVRQKRFQGSHGVNDEQARAYNDLVRKKVLDPCVGRVVPFDQVGQVHWEMGQGTAPNGNTVVLVGAPRPGLGRG